MKILIAIEDDQSASTIVDFIIKNLDMRSEFQVLHVIRPIASYVSVSMVPELMDDLRREARTNGERIVRNIALKIRDVCHSADVKELVAEGTPAHEIAAVARDWQADLLIVGSHGRQGLHRFFLGSVSEGVATLASCCVLVVRPAACYAGDGSAGQKIAVATYI